MSDASEILGYVGGGTGLVAGGVWLVKALAGRVVQREDEDKRHLLSRAEKSEERERVISEALINIRHDMQAMRDSLGQMKQQNEFRAAAQDKEIAELRAEVKEQIGQLEHRLRSDMQRIVNESERAEKSRRGGKRT